MAQGKPTIFQKLTDLVIGTGNVSPSKSVSNYTINADSDILYRFDNEQDRDDKLRQLRQEKLLAYQWAKTGRETTMQQMQGLNQVRVMYRDADLMDGWPEIGAALDCVAEEACTVGKEGKILNIHSKSDRIVSVLEDLFINRLDIHVTGPMIVRSLAKYGNEFMFLNIDSKNGVMGWREMPVYEMDRIENGIGPYMSGFGSTQSNNLKPDEVKFIWDGHSSQPLEYKNWQIAHFRLIKDSLFLPYGVSYLNKARRSWRMLSMMEDAMLLYRLERSVERRIFKVNVGAIDNADVPAFLQEFMNNIKRAPIVDPQTGQIDLRKNFLDVNADYVIPVRNGQDPTNIDNLASTQNITSMDDIEYMQNKVLSALRLPKSFLNFQEAQGKGQNLSIMDIRFSRVINSIQQAFIMELTKIAIIHLYLLGFIDDLTNFSITMNNPSNQIEAMELENMQKRLNNAATALQEQGGGIPLMSWHKVQKEIMGLTDSQISDMLNEIRLESAIANELKMTNQIIKKTDVFKKVDRIYGEPGATYSANAGAEGEEGGGGPMGGGGMMMGGDESFGDDLGDLGEPGADTEGTIGGEAGEADLASMGDEDNGNPMEGRLKNGKNILLEKSIDKYLEMLNSSNDGKRTELYDKSFLINEEFDSIIKNLEGRKHEDIVDDETVEELTKE